MFVRKVKEDGSTAPNTDKSKEACKHHYKPSVIKNSSAKFLFADYTRSTETAKPSLKFTMCTK